MSLHRTRLISALALSFAAACSGADPTTGASANVQSGGAGTVASGGDAGTGGSGGISSGGAGQADPSGTGGSGGATATGGGGAGSKGTAGTDGGIEPPGTDGGGAIDPISPRSINVLPGSTIQMSFNGQSMSINKSKPIVGKLVLLLGGICTGTGAGGFEAFVKQYGFHVFAPKTQTCVTSAPQNYKDILKTTPTDPEANRQVADARMELWDGKDRVDWVTVAPGESIVEETVAALKAGTTMDPGADWGYFLNADGTLRTTDVWVVGYSWGSQSWAMISSYVRFGRVITTSGPQDEGFPNAAWITHPSATPGDRKYLLVGFQSPYPSADKGDDEVSGMFTTVTKAGWVGVPTNVMPNGMGTYTADQHLFAMVGSNNASPGGHTVFCTDNPANGWVPLCKHVLDVK